MRAHTNQKKNQSNYNTIDCNTIVTNSMSLKSVRMREEKSHKYTVSSDVICVICMVYVNVVNAKR